MTRGQMPNTIPARNHGVGVNDKSLPGSCHGNNESFVLVMETANALPGLCHVLLTPQHPSASFKRVPGLLDSTMDLHGDTAHSTLVRIFNTRRLAAVASVTSVSTSACNAVNMLRLDPFSCQVFVHCRVGIASCRAVCFFLFLFKEY